MQSSYLPVKNLEDLVHRMTDRIRRSLELPEILEATADELRRFLKVDRVKVYRFHDDASGEVVAEAIKRQRLPSLLGQRFPAGDIPEDARELFLAVRQRSIVNVARHEIGVSPLLSEQKVSEPQNALLANLSFRKVDPCHIEYLKAMGVQASLVVPILHRHKLWGLLVAHHSVARRFGNKELEIVQLIADQVTVAIAHANLLQITRSQGQHESVINQTVSHLHSTGNNPLKNALSQMVSALGCVGGRLYIPTDKAGFRLITDGIQPQTLKTSIESGLEPSGAATVLERQSSWKTWLEAEADSQIVANLWAIADIEHPRVSSGIVSAFSRSHIRGVLVAKLVHRNRFLGYLSLFRQAIDTETIWAGRLDASDARQQRPRESFEAWREIKKEQPQPWRSREIGLAQDLADRFASAIYQMQLYEKVQALNANLEAHVLQRTAQLEQANESLKQEITERERAFDELQKARDALKRLSHQNELILDSAGEGIYGIDPKGKIVFVNPAALKALGRSKKAVINYFMHDLICHSKPDGTRYPWRQSPIYNTLKHGQTQHVAGDLFQRQGQSFPVEYVSTSIWEQGKIIGAVVVFQDITERQEIELMRDEFIAVVSHELRTPLTSIRAALGLLAQKKLEVPAAQRQRMVEIAFSNTNRLVRLVSDILDVERIKLGKITLSPQTCDLAEIMTQAADEMRAMAENRNISLKVSPLSIQIEVDRDRIVQTLTNLLSNAIKFSPTGRAVAVSAQQVDATGQLQIAHELSAAGEKAIQATLAQAPSILLIQVKDQGEGIPEDKLEAVFGQFEQLNTSDAAHQGGTGLGLAICRSIVQQHRGKIWAQSVPGVGSTFCFTLPLPWTN